MKPLPLGNWKKLHIFHTIHDLKSLIIYMLISPHIIHPYLTSYGEQVNVVSHVDIAQNV